MSIREGSLLILTGGAYSSYSLYAVAKAKSDMDLDALKREFEDDKNQGRGYDNFYRFIAWLDAKGLLEELTYQEVHLGDYGSLYPIASEPTEPTRKV